MFETTGKTVLFTGVSLTASIIFWVFFPMKFQADMALLLVLLLGFHLIGALDVHPADPEPDQTELRVPGGAGGARIPAVFECRRGADGQGNARVIVVAGDGDHDGKVRRRRRPLARRLAHLPTGATFAP